MLLYGILKISQSQRHPATTRARLPKGQMTTQQQLKTHNRTCEKPADIYHSRPLLPQRPRDFRESCHIAPSSPAAQPLLGHTGSRRAEAGGAPEARGGAPGLPACSARGPGALAGPMLRSPSRRQPTTRTPQESEKDEEELSRGSWKKRVRGPESGL